MNTPQILQQVISPAVSDAYRRGLDHVQGFVVNAADVAGARTAADVVDAFGSAAVANTLLQPDGSVDVLRFAVGTFLRLSVPYGPGFAPAGERAFDEPPPFTGNGFTASSRSVVPQWYLDRARLTAGAELWRIGPDGGEQFIDAYRDVGLGWGSSTGIPSHLLGPKASFEGRMLLADVVGDGAVVLAELGPDPSPGFEPVRPFVARRVVPAADAGPLIETVLTCTWRGEPFEVINSDPNEAVITYTGRDYRVAQALGLRYAQPAVYETTVPLGELTDIGGIERQAPPAT